MMFRTHNIRHDNFIYIELREVKYKKHTHTKKKQQYKNK